MEADFERARRLSPDLVKAPTPDKQRYSIEQVERVGQHLVMKVLYPNCQKCAFDGLKVMVFLNVTEAEALRWREIDPHFRDLRQTAHVNVIAAPSPAARFPGSSAGWEDAIEYAQRKDRR